MPAIPFSKITQPARDLLARAYVEIKPVLDDNACIIDDEYGIINLEPLRDKVYKLAPWDHLYQISGVLLRGTGVTTILYTIHDKEEFERFEELMKSVRPLMYAQAL